MTSETRSHESPRAPEEPYASNASLARIVEGLADARRVVILTHAKPDGDAVGSSLALARALTRRGARATPVYLAPWSPRMDAIVGDTPVLHEQQGIWGSEPLTEADRVVVVDTGAWSQVADARAWLEPRREITIVIDHHAHGDASLAATRHIDPAAAAAAELVAPVCLGLLGEKGVSGLPVEVAEPLYLGLATDTGWFRHSNVTPRVLRMAADFLDAGVDQNRLYRLVEQSDSPKRLSLIGRALASLEYLCENRAAVMRLSAADISACEAGQDELGGLTDLPQSVGSVRVVAVLSELEPGLTKVSMRSKAVEPLERPVDVNRMAQRLGGGGHLHAAGAKVRAPIEEAHRLVSRLLTDALR